MISGVVNGVHVAVRGGWGGMQRGTPGQGLVRGQW